MPQIFGSGEMAQRLRRLLDFRGRFPGQLDETIVPVVLAGDATAPPYRTSSRRWWGSDGIVTGAAGVAGSWVHNSSPNPIIVDWCQAWVIIPNDDFGSLMLLGTRVGFPSAITLQVPCVTTEAGNPITGVNDSGTDQVPVEIASSEPGGSQLGTTLRRIWAPNAGLTGVAGLPSNAIDVLDAVHSISLGPGMSLGLEVQVSGIQEFMVSWSGLYLDDAPLQMQR